MEWGREGPALGTGAGGAGLSGVSKVVTQGTQAPAARTQGARLLALPYST